MAREIQELGASGGPPWLDRAARILLGLLLLAIAASAVYAAWLCDDYLIGLRQVINLVRGDGFSFNSDSRVQTMTSPLWGLFLVPVYAVSDGWYGPLIASILLSLGAVIALVRQFWREPAARGPLLGVLALLLMSKAFMDFTTSGLENPLAYAVASAWCCALLRFMETRNRRTFSLITALAGTMFLVRYDYALLVAPSLVWCAWQLRARRDVVLGALVLCAVTLPWLIFSLVYYGTFLSNSYYAKVTTKIPTLDALHFGLSYWKAMLLHDPVTLFVLASGVAVAVRRSASTFARVQMAAALLYSIYLTLIGGDFMLGRFLSVTTLVAAFVLVDCLRRPTGAWMKRRLLLAAGAVTLLAPRPPVLHTYFTQNEMRRDHVSVEVLPRIADEKNAYVGARGLISGWHQFEPWLRERIASGPKERNGPRRVVGVDCGGLGWLAFDVGMDAHVFDRCALADPFLSKLPLYEIGRDHVLLSWGPGHYSRIIPPGYVDSLAEHRNLISDPILASTFDDIQLVTTGHLFAPGRWAAIARLVSGALVRKAATAQAYFGTNPATPVRSNFVRYDDLERMYFTRCMYEYSNRIVAPGQGLSILLQQPLGGGTLKLSAQPNIDYRLDFYAAGVEVGHQDVRLSPACHSAALAESEIQLKPKRSKNFDRIDIVPVGTTQPAGIGGVFLENTSRARPIATFQYKAADVPGSTGVTLPSGAREGIAGRDRVGHLMFGPYVRLAPGKYVVEIGYRGARMPGVRNGGWDVTLWQGAVEKRLAGGVIEGSQSTGASISAPIVMPPTPTDARVEIRVFFDGSGDLVAEGASVRPVL